MERIRSVVKHISTCHQLLSVQILRQNTYLLYRLWCVVLILSYYEFGFKVIHIASNHDFNYIITCIVNVITYVFVERMYSRLGFRELLAFVFVVLFAVTRDPAKFWRLRHDNGVPSDYEASIEIAGQFGLTGLFGYMLMYTSDVYNQVVRERAKEEAKETKPVKEIPIEIRDITLGKLVYPRLSKACSWLEKRYHDVLNVEDFENIERASNTHVLILKSGTISDKYQICFATKDIQLDDRKPVKDTTFAGQYLEGLLNTFTNSRVPFVIICFLTLDKNGYIAKEDRKLISEIQKSIIPTLSNRKIEMVFVVDGDSNTDLESISCVIQYKLKIKGYTNPIYCKTFNAYDHSTIRKRVGLYLERQFEAALVDILRDRQAKSFHDEDYKPNGTVHFQNHSGSNYMYEKVNPFKEVLSHFQHLSPDNCAINELEVLLERSPVVAAYGFEDNTITVFVADNKQIPGVRSYLNKYFPDMEDQIKFGIWERESKLAKYVLQQGSKVARPDSKFGTLGMFLKDDKGNIYFTTCSHVIELNQTATDEDNTVIGKSVFSIDTGPDMKYSELIDLSIVKVEDSVIPQCQFGLRSFQNVHKDGQIVEEETVTKGKNLKVYKWGAATGLTRGTYKGWIASRSGRDRFDQNLHRIVPESNLMFEEGDSGCLVCFEATGSPYLDCDSAGYIFVGKEVSKTEYRSCVSEDPLYYCYHVSKVLVQKVEDVNKFEPCLEPNMPTDSILVGQPVHC